ncbi:MAG: AAA family ATPase, partial [Candidatus Methanomethylophilaceae archaeon]|nr:AAA family ATPase [Candidatus Methanomethylophilaceae archaeon]
MDSENGITAGGDDDDMRGPPVGNDNFRKLRDRDSYYVDKTGLIREIVRRSDVDVFQFTRPRRFGK